MICVQWLETDGREHSGLLWSVDTTLHSDQCVWAQISDFVGRVDAIWRVNGIFQSVYYSYRFSVPFFLMAKLTRF